VSRAFTVGRFDGVHLGHRRVLEALLAQDPLGRVYVLADDGPSVSSVERRVELLQAAGVEDVVVGDAAVAAGVYVTGPRLHVHHAQDVVRVPLVEGVSSERVRQLVSAGELAGAAQLLGRPLEVDGIVVHGDHRGRELGFPTANLDLPAARVLPPLGVYAGAVGDHLAAISIGDNPQFGGTTLRFEAHLLDFDGDLYGQRLVVEVWSRLRGQQVFESVEALVEAIAADVEEARRATRPG
jgi:riboflavin kinase / FMN adenylyltransferase